MSDAEQPESLLHTPPQLLCPGYFEGKNGRITQYEGVEHPLVVITIGNEVRLGCGALMGDDNICTGSRGKIVEGQTTLISHPPTLSYTSWTTVNGKQIPCRILEGLRTSRGITVDAQE